MSIDQTVQKHTTGVQHIGIPTNNIEETIDFYTKLGFTLIYKTVNEAANETVGFLQLGNLIVETYENKQATLQTGAIDHIAIDVKDIAPLFEKIKEAGYKLITEEIQSLPFWESGIKYFIIEGPNKEKLEFCERL